jgi:hypothetical protein
MGTPEGAGVMNGQTADVADGDPLRDSKTLPHADLVRSVAEHVNTLPGARHPEYH